MTEHNNPLMRRNPGEPPRGGATVEDLQRHCDWLNSLNFVIASRKPYFVRKREDGLHEVARSA